MTPPEGFTRLHLARDTRGSRSDNHDRATGEDVVFVFSFLTLDGAAQRGWSFAEDRLLQSLLADDRVGRLLIAETLRRAPAWMTQTATRRPRLTSVASPSIRVVRPFRLLRSRPTSLKAVERVYTRYGNALRRAADRMGLTHPVLITANPFVAGFSDLSWARSVTYYGFDDFTLLDGCKPVWDLYREAYERIRARRHRIAAVTGHLRDRLINDGPSVVVPNGLEPGEWSGSCTPPPFARDSRRPILVYAGTLDARLDYRIVAQTASAMPDARVAIVGHRTDRAPVAELARIPNVEIYEELGRKEYSGLLRAASVGLIPHVRTQLTATVEPQKVWEYLAAGLPVVSTDLPPVKGINPRVQLVPDHENFPEAVKAALASGRASEDERCAFVRANSWRARHDAVLALAMA